MDKPDFLDATFIVNCQQIEKINEYCKGGGLERYVETSRQFYELSMANLRILELMANRDKKEPK